MTKDEFLEQFATLNTFIESAIAMQDFDRVRLIDGARRKMLQEFAISSVAPLLNCSVIIKKKKTLANSEDGR